MNVFWRHLESKEYDKNDMYGNHDLVSAMKADQILDRALKQLDALPSPYRTFYAKRMMAKIDSKICNQSHDQGIE